MTQPSYAASDGQLNLKSRWPRHDEDEIAAVVAVLRSGRVNSLHHGEQTSAFEAAFAAYCGMPYALALANGTLALELGLRALGIGAGDEVIVPARSFFASASAVVACGARPVFADVDPISQTICPASIRQLLTSRTRAILCVHLAGWPCAMDELGEICRTRNLFLVEDCAQAHGATFAGQMVGSFGDVAAFSFCTDKIMSTGGEGGMLLVRDSAVFERAWAYKDHGKDRRRTMMPSVPSAEFRWLHDSFGSNFRMTEMQAAIGLAQLAKLPAWLDARRRNAARLAQALRKTPLVRVVEVPDHIGHAGYKFYAFADRFRDELAAAIIARGISCGSGSCPEMYREAAIAGSDLAPAIRLPHARKLGETSLMFQIDPTLDEAAMTAFGKIVGAAAWQIAADWPQEHQPQEHRPQEHRPQEHRPQEHRPQEHLSQDYRPQGRSAA